MGSDPFIPKAPRSSRRALGQRAGRLDAAPARDPDWKERYRDRIGTAAAAAKTVGPGSNIFIGTGCAEPQHLVEALVANSRHIHDAHVIHMLTLGAAPYAEERFRDRFVTNSFFIADNVRHALERGIGQYVPMLLSQIPREFQSGRIPIDAALISVTPPDTTGRCSLGVSVDIVKAAAANAKRVIAQVNANMPWTMGHSFLRVQDIDMLVPHDEPIVEVPSREPDETLRRIGRNIARLVEDGSTIECGIGRIPHALAECLKDKKDLGVHTEMFSDWIIDLIECGAITCARKTINRGRAVASFCMGSRRLYDYIDGNPFFDFRPTEYVNDPAVISRHERMIAINVGLEVDLTGQVCSDSVGYRFYSGIGGQVDFVRGAAASPGGKAIIALPATAHNGSISRIVSHLSEGAGVVTTRGDVHYVVTEFGIAYLHGKSIRERALALVNIAHPRFRNELLHAAKDHNYIQQDQIELAWEEVTYPEELERHSSLRDGTDITFRPVKPTDESALAEMLYSLSDRSRRARYFTHTTTFPHSEVQKLTNIDYKNELAIVGIAAGRGADSIVAIGQYFLDAETRAAEVAFVVRDEWQARGIGTFLMDYLTRIARRRGIRRFWAKVLPTNRPMLAIFRNCRYKADMRLEGQAHNVVIDLTSENKEGPRSPSPWPMDS